MAPLRVFLPHVGRSANRKSANPRVVAAIGGLITVLLASSGGYLTRANYRVRHVFQPTQVLITQSEVGVHHSRGKSGRRGSTYSIDIRFNYAVAGVNYFEGRYEFLHSSSSGRSSKDAIVRRYPVGSTQTAWYDPDDPSVAVLCRDFSWLGPALFGLSAIPAGIALVSVRRIRSVRSVQRKIRRAATSDTNDHRVSDDFNAPPPPAP